MATRVLLLVGTRKGAFIAESDAARAAWTLRGPLCEGWPVHDMSVDPASGAIYAAAGSPWYGPAVWRSDDLGETWTHSSAGLTYGDDGPAIPTVWNVTAAHGAVFAGVEPAGLFRSDDDGATWTHVTGLTEHPSRPEWQPGNGGLILHTIVPHATDPRRMWVGISAVGTFETRDGGATWETRNRGVRADFVPDPYAGVRPVRPQARRGGRRARDALPAEPLRRLPLRRRRRDLDRDHGRACPPSSASRWSPIRATPPRPGSSRSTPPTGAASCPTPPPPSGGPATAARAGSGCPPGSPRSTPTSASCARRWPSTASTRWASRSGRATASSGRAPTKEPTWSLVAAHLPDIWSVEAHVVEG